MVKKKLVLGAHFNLAAFGFSLLLGFCTIGFDSLHIFPLRSRFYINGSCIPVKRRDFLSVIIRKSGPNIFRRDLIWRFGDLLPIE